MRWPEFDLDAGEEREDGERVYSVSEVTARIKAVLEETLPLLWVEGEISNFVHHSSGHMYFTLKDDRSRLPAVMFRSQNRRLAFAPSDGAKVVAWGRIGVYEPSGRYQLYVERMRPAGVGDLAAAYERLKAKLAQEGLFDPAHKVPIPRFPETVAIVTSPTGAALRDVIRVIRARAPWTRLVLVPASVQGPSAAAEIASAIALLDEWGGADVAIVGRGGGSLEDLWAFNEEVVARAIYAASTPIVSAVGHEIDFTIADFVADLRAATPSNAGELVVSDRAELRRSVATLERRAGRAVRNVIGRRREILQGYRAAYGFRLPRGLIERQSERIDELAWRMLALVRGRVDAIGARLAAAASALRLGDPTAILSRGFASVGLLPSLAPVRSVGDVREGREVRVTVADGSFDCRVDSVRRREGRKP
jgi:exodeoxyribonuclease VII large subunit